MKIEKLVTSGVFRLDGGEWEVDNNVYLLASVDEEGSKEEVIIVDPSHDAEAVYAAVGDRNVQCVLLTHAHNDHCELAPAVASHYGVEVYLHPDDQPLWEETNGNAAYTPLRDGQQFVLGGENVSIRHTPGHSPGCIVAYVASEDTLLSGDTLFNGGPGATGRKYSSFETIIASLKEKVFTLPADTRVLPGHGDETTVGAEAARIDEYIARSY